MADPGLEAIARQGTEAWNAWRRDHPGAPVDLQGAELAGARLRGADLSGVDLSFARLSGAQLSTANLTG